MRPNGAGIEQIAVRAGDHTVSVLADEDTGAFQALVEQDSQLDRPLPWAAVPAVTAVSTGHGRRARRTIKAALAPAWIGFAGAAQVARLRRTVTKKGRKTVEVVYLITSDRDADPATLAARVRGHWEIENKLHWVRDVTYQEDKSLVRTGNAPRVMASLSGTRAELEQGRFAFRAGRAAVEGAGGGVQQGAGLAGREAACGGAGLVDAADGSGGGGCGKVDRACVDDGEDGPRRWICPYVVVLSAGRPAPHQGLRGGARFSVRRHAARTSARRLHYVGDAGGGR
jgi:predicted transposase YbfD/YdcC